MRHWNRCSDFKSRNPNTEGVEMGFNSDLASAAKQLKADINKGVDMKDAVLTFADRVEKAAEAKNAAIQQLLKECSENPGPE